MYRIRLETGEETEFNSFEELSFGIVSGIVGPESEIYHERAEKWLPIKVHPEYKRAVGSAPPPPPATKAASNGRSSDGMSNLVREPDPHVPVRSDRGDEGGLDLLTLLDLEDLGSTDPGKVQESAVEDPPSGPVDAADEWVDPADWIGDEDDSEPLVPVDEPHDEPAGEYVGESSDDPSQVLEASEDVVVAAPVAEPFDDLEPTPDLDDPAAVSAEAIPAMLDEGDVDYLGEMLDSGDSDLTSPALDAESHALVEDDSVEVGGDDDTHVADAEAMEFPEVVPVEASAPPEAAGTDAAYPFAFPPATPPEPEEFEDLSPEFDQSDVTESPDLESDPESGFEAAAIADPVSPEAPVAEPPAPLLLGAGTVPEVRPLPTPSFDREMRRAPEARNGLRDLLPIDLPKPPVLAGIAAVVVVALVATWMLLRPNTGAAGTEPSESGSDSAVVAPAIPTPPRPTVDVTAQRRTYERGYAQSGSVLEDEIRRSGINYLFSSSRFSSEGDMLAARRAVAQARSAVTGYRAREDSLERLFPEADPSLKEPRVYAELTDDILSVGDGVYAILLGHLDDYAIRSGAVTFTDARVEAQYTRLLGELDRLLSLAGEGQGDRPATLRRVFDAVDATRPPPLAIIAPPPPLPGAPAPSRN